MISREDRLEIRSTGNPKVKEILRLSKKSERKKAGLMAVEGVREIRAAIEGGFVIREAYYCPAVAATEEERSLLEALNELRINTITISRKVFGKLAYRGTTGGFVAVAENPGRRIKDLAPGENPLYVVVDGIEKPGNIGALFRTADSAGASGLIASSLKTDLFNPNIIRASLGTVFTLPAAEAAEAETIDWLRDNDIRIVASSPDGESIYTDIDYRGPSAIVVGSEDEGLSPLFLKEADVLVRIPMRGNADSLNVSVSGAVILFEAVRQRRA